MIINIIPALINLNKIRCSLERVVTNNLFTHIIIIINLKFNYVGIRRAEKLSTGP
jgi:hypothetical protein